MHLKLIISKYFFPLKIYGNFHAIVMNKNKPRNISSIGSILLYYLSQNIVMTKL